MPIMRHSDSLFNDGETLYFKRVLLSTEILNDSPGTITNVSGFIYSLLLAKSNAQQLKRTQSKGRPRLYTILHIYQLCLGVFKALDLIELCCSFRE